MNKIIHIFLALITLILVLPILAPAQELRNLQLQYEQARKQLEFARDVYASYPITTGRTLLVEAEKNLETARAFWESGQYLRSRRHLETAIMLIERALGQILREPIQLQRERLDELIERAENLVGRGSNPNAEKFIQQAKDHRSRAIRAFSSQQYQLALEQFRYATYMANKAVEIATQQSDNILERVRDEEARLEELFERARKAIEERDNPAAQKFYQLAERQQQQIERLKSSRNYDQVIEHINQATRLLLRAIDIASDNKKQIELRVFDDVIALDELIENLNNSIESTGESNNTRIDFLLDRIYSLQQQAHQALEEQKYQECQFHTRMARKLVERALQIASRKNPRQYEQRVYDELDQLEISIDNVRQKLSSSTQPEAEEMLNMAERISNRAKQFADRNNIAAALANIAVSNQILLKTEALIDGLSSDEQSDGLTNNINRLRQLISEHNEQSNQPRLLFREAQHMLAQAETYITKGYLQAARICIDAADRYLQRVKN
ncbi:hypothetical protein JW960_28045 [candidate division KSB1 bacterium]|nr:hypothetical protein [candidate division KSB1 bacterium]